MTAVFLLAWLAFPVLMLVLCTGAGLAARRVAGSTAVPGVLVVPVGLAVLVVLCGLLCYFAPLAQLAGPACALVGVLGLVTGRAELRRMIDRRAAGADVWALGAAFGAWLILAAPVLLSGKPGFTGYAHIVDTSYQFDLAAHFAHAGRSIPATGNSGYDVVLRKYLESGYPGGGQWTLGALSNLTPVDLSWLYQPFLAFLSAMSALSLYALLGPLVQSRRWRALGAFVAAQPNILIAYALAGGIKELSTSCFLLLLAALIAQVTPRVAPGRGVLAIPVALAATFASLSLTTLPWLGVLGVGVFVTVLAFQRDRLRVLLAGGEIALVAFVISLPTIAASLKLVPSVTGVVPAELGNLTAAVPSITAAGVWISGDYRFPQDAHLTPSHALAALALTLAAGGLIFALRRKAWSVVWLGIAGIIAVFYVHHRYGPWIQLKSFCVTAPIALLLAFAGVGALMRVTRRVAVGAVPALLLAAGVLAGNALLYHDTTLAPYARLSDLEHIGKRFAGQGPTLTPDFEEYAEYYLRDDTQDSMVNGPRLELRPSVNRATEPGNIFQYDLNEYPLGFIESFRTIVMRRNPLASRPPSNFKLVYLSPYYEVWQRAAPASTVRALVPFADTAGANNSAACASVLRQARSMGPGALIDYTTVPSGYVQLDDSNMTLGGGFAPSGGVILATGAGRAVRKQPIPAAGRYDFFLEGSFSRPVDVSVDGRHVGTAAYQASYPDEWLLIASRELSKGPHRVEVTRGGSSLHPASGDGVDALNRTIGPLVIIPASPVAPAVHSSAVAEFGRLCASSHALRWAEVVPGA